MGKFDGYLICSDLDGTFRNGEDTVLVNSEAVKYFTDNGGKFTFATGRMIDHLRECNLDKIINAPAALCNGSIIFDCETNAIIREKRVDFTVSDFIDAIKDQLDLNAALYVHSDFPEGYQRRIDFNCAKQLPAEMRAIMPLKIVCAFSSVDDADMFKSFAQNSGFFANTSISKSWGVGVEFNSTEATKGKGIEFIKQYLGNVHTAIGVGDYENDLPLITCADIGVAVGNAVEELKTVADMIVKPVSEYAIKDLIEKIEPANI